MHFMVQEVLPFVETVFLSFKLTGLVYHASVHMRENAGSLDEENLRKAFHIPSD